jgi:hypothetical protein
VMSSVAARPPEPAATTFGTGFVLSDMRVPPRGVRVRGRGGVPARDGHPDASQRAGTRVK